MPGTYRRPGTTRARRQAQQRRQLYILGAALLTLIALVSIVLLIPKGNRRDDAAAPAPVTATPAPEAVSPAEPARDESADAPTEVEAGLEADGPAADAALPESGELIEAAPTPAPTPTPDLTVYDRAATRPTPTATGFIPVFIRAKTEEKIIAVTVDDCFQADNLQQIIDAATAVGGKLTIFPIGQQALRDKQAAILKTAWENGFELENHTYTHNGLYWVSDDVLAKEIFWQQMALSHILGMEYQCHFLRPGGGDARNDQRMQKYAEQMGYYGIAHWSCAGSTSTDAAIVEALKPGAIYLFHTTNNDLDKLVRFIPYAAGKGYRLVTLNEMFDYPANETEPLKMAAKDYPVPPLEPFERVLVTFKKTTYNSGVMLLQQKLIELGYLSGKVDGIYGDGCVKAIKAYQKDHGLEQDGIATPELQERIFAE